METQVYHAHMDELMPLFREQLAAGKSVRFSPKGISMLCSYSVSSYVILVAILGTCPNL